MKNKQLYRICESAVLVALAIALCAIEIQIGALGGSIDFVMIPLFIIAYRNGLGYGITSGLVFGFVKCLIGGGIGWGLPSILLDYVLAYGAVGLAGIFKEKSWAIELSTFIGCFAGVIIVVLADEDKFHFDTKAVWWAQILKAVLGLGVVLAVKEGMRPVLELFLPAMPARAVRYCLIVLVAGILWPPISLPSCSFCPC